MKKPGGGVIEAMRPWCSFGGVFYIILCSLTFIVPVIAFTYQQSLKRSLSVRISSQNEVIVS